MREYDVIIIGAGMSGLAAGIRLAHYGWKVAIMEKHTRLGGMNSWYCRQGREFDVGLHAMTNFQPPGSRTSPLGKILKQLRLRYHELDLTEQNYSLIQFPEAELRFSNDFRQLQEEVADTFPQQVDGLNRLCRKIDDFDSLSLHPPRLSTRKIMAECISDPLLQEMLLCPMMYYGSASENDMDFASFCVMFQSVFREGLCRPRQGIRSLLELLSKRYQKTGGELYLQCGVKSIITENRRLSAVELDSGETVQTKAVLSSAGYPETMRLCRTKRGLQSETWRRKEKEKSGNMSFVEAIFVLDKPTRNFTDGATIIFQVNRRPFKYQCPEGLINNDSGVICFPDNFASPARRDHEGSMVRLTRIANFSPWASLNAAEYRSNKRKVRDHLWQDLQSRFSGIDQCWVADDLFTPRTIERYTGRQRGAVYGVPFKRRDGRTPVENLFICGTDQGFLGITGALLSGVSMVNYHFFTKR